MEAKNDITTVHFIGIGGVGMSGIARVAHDQGLTVSGSDLKASRYTEQLVEAGIQVFIGHDASNLPADDNAVVVVSTAILQNNPELKAAHERGMAIWHRAQMLAFLGRDKQTLAVAGTHGKTTSSSMLASVLDALGTEPSFLIGGIVRTYGTNAHSGKGPFYVVEADESDKSFTYLHPHAVMVTNVEADHLDHYKDVQEIHELFSEFMGQVDPDGVLVVCGDDAALSAIAQKIDRKVITYGTGADCDVVVSSYEPRGVGSAYEVTFPDGRVVSGTIKQNPGIHNVLNAAGVLTTVAQLGYDPQEAADALANFAGVHRRFELVGEADGVTVVDDYAHHPTEITATIEAASKLGFKKVHVIFQPHRYSRVGLFTEVLRDDFAKAFDQCDTVTFMDVYAAGETPVPGVSGKTFMDVLLESPNHPELTYLPRRLEMVSQFIDRLAPGDLVITMGAGDVTSVGGELVAALQERADASQA